MSKVKNTGVKISGIIGAVPDNPISIYELGKPYFTEEEIKKIGNSVGTDTLYFTKKGQTSGDLGIAAGKRLLEALDWEKGSIDAVIFVSQTLDYAVPPTSCRIQSALGLTNEIIVMDLNYGCMGFIKGLMIASQMIQSGACKRILLINSECHTNNVSRSDLDTALIFGDGASAVGVEKVENEVPSYFMGQVDGNYCEELVLGWYKNASNGSIKDKNFVYMNGEAVTTYMLRELPKFANKLLTYSKSQIDDIDTVLLHQANAYMIRFLAKRMKANLSKVPININKFGNTSGPSIPLLICDTKPELFLPGKREKILAIGFGSGFIIEGTVLELEELKGGDILFV